MSVISWQSFLLVEETGVPCRRSLTNLFYHIMLYRVDLAIVGFKLTKLVEIGTDYTGNCKSNYYTITTAPHIF